MEYIILFTIMLFAHIVDDFYLQGVLATLKQKATWKKIIGPYGFENSKYKNDYKVALIAHGFSWSFIVHLPIMAYAFYQHQDPVIYYSIVASIFIHAFIHADVDNDKANRKVINLVTDQSFHLAQIIIMLLVYIVNVQLFL